MRFPPKVDDQELMKLYIHVHVHRGIYMYTGVTYTMGNPHRLCMDIYILYIQVCFRIIIINLAIQMIAPTVNICTSNRDSLVLLNVMRDGASGNRLTD